MLVDVIDDDIAAKFVDVADTVDEPIAILEKFYLVKVKPDQLQIPRPLELGLVLAVDVKSLVRVLSLVKKYKSRKIVKKCW